MTSTRLCLVYIHLIELSLSTKNTLTISISWETSELAVCIAEDSVAMKDLTRSALSREHYMLFEIAKKN